MAQAIAAARAVMGTTHPNPAVGAVIVHNGVEIARGATAPDGGPHAEALAIEAFAKSGHHAGPGTCLYVTLEPCSTAGRTGACTERIIAAGIPEVVIGAIDPNPAHCGRGIDILQAAGIRVRVGILQRECEDLNLIFNWRQTQRRPLVAAKVATTLDGRIATRGGLSKWITGPQAREDVHRWRRYFPAIAVGANTVVVDNPMLTVRLPETPEYAPRRFVFDRNLVSFRETLPTLYSDAERDKTVVVTMATRAERARELAAEHGLEFWLVEPREADDGLGHFLEKCMEEHIWGLYIEGGSHLLSSFLGARKIDYLFAYRAPKLLADTEGLAPFAGQEPEDMTGTIQLEKVVHESFGDDQLMRGYVVYPPERSTTLIGGGGI